MDHKELLKRIIKKILIFIFLFSICFGLGYPTLNRYDPRIAPGTNGKFFRDPAEYYKMIQFDFNSVKPPFRYRVLLPFFSYLVYRCICLMKINFGSWDKILLSFLIINSVCVSVSAVLIYQISLLLFNDILISIISLFLLMTNFIIINCHLAGLIDSGELMIIYSAVFILIKKKYIAFPVLFLLGALTKETTVLFLSALLISHLIFQIYQKALNKRQLLIYSLSIVMGCCAIVTIRKLIGGEIYKPHQLSLDTILHLPSNFMAILMKPKAIIYSFGLLFPLSLLRIKKIPKDILSSSIAMGVLSILLGAYAGINGDNLARPLFNTLSILVITSSAIYMKELLMCKRELNFSI